MGEPEIERLLPSRDGHFAFESGHHSPTWIDLERLFLEPGAIRPAAVELAERLRPLGVEVVCGPLVEGAFVALMVAEHLGLPFTYAERIDDGGREGLFPIRYRLPAALHEVVLGRSVAIVNDVVSAGSAVRGTHADLVEHGATPVALVTVAVLGDGAARFASGAGLRLVSLLQRPLTIWTPEECPLCAAGEPLTTPTSFAGS